MSASAYTKVVGLFAAPGLAAALVVFGPVAVADAAPTLINLNHAGDGVVQLTTPGAQTVNTTTIDEMMAAGAQYAAPGETTAFAAAGLDALWLNGKSADIAALPGNKMVVTYQDPSAPGGILRQLHLVQAAPADPNVSKYLLVEEYNLVDDAPNVLGIGFPFALANSVATMALTSQQDYRDGYSGSPMQVFYNDPSDPSKGFTAVILSQDLALTKLIRAVPVVGPTVATATAPALERLVNSSYTGRNTDGTLMSYGENPGLKLPSLESQTDLVKHLPGDLQQGLNDVQAQQQVPAPNSAPSDPGVSSFSNNNAPQTNVVRNGLVAKPGQQFANDAKKTADKVTADLNKTVKQVTTGVNDVVKQVTTGVTKAVNDAVKSATGNLPKPHGASTGGSGGSSSGSGGE